MAIKEGDKLPEVTLHTMKDGKPTAVKTSDIFGGKKVVLFAVPGAFTPTCSLAHLPGYVVNADKIKAKGVDSIVCVSVNDAFVMDSWGKSANADEIVMVGDGNGDFTRALGLELDASAYGMGIRAKRFALYAEDGVVKQLHVEAPGEYKVSSAEHLLASV